MRTVPLALLPAVLTLVLLLVTPTGTAVDYAIFRDGCARSSTLQLYCDNTPAKDNKLLYKHCDSEGYGVGYITNDAELNAAASAMRAVNVTKAYVGAQLQMLTKYWCWMADGWTFNGSSVFFVGDLTEGGFVFGSEYWDVDYPTISTGIFVQLDISGAAPVMKNVGGQDILAFYVLCERAKRSPPQFEGAPTTYEGAGTQEPSTSPTGEPTGTVAPDPSNNPTANPTANPTTSPTGNPTGNPTTGPTTSPTTSPTASPTTTTTTSAPSQESDSEFPVWVIGVIVDIVLLVIIVAVILILWYCAKKKKQQRKAAHKRSHSNVSDTHSATESSRSFS